MKVLQEVRKEDELYYEGPFWIIGDSFKDILKGNFKLVFEKYACNYDGNSYNDTPKNNRTHKYVWNLLKDSHYVKDKNVDYTYYPRGRVGIYNGTAFININSKCNTPKIISNIINEYNLHNLDIELSFDDEIQGSHYDFKLK